MADLLSENATESIRNGFIELGVDQIWQVITASRTTAFTAVLLDPTLPALGSSQLFDGQLLYLVDRRPSRVNQDATGRKWEVNCQWSNRTASYMRNVQGEPVSDPVDAAKNVDITWQEYSEPITNATFRNQTEDGGFSVGTTIAAPYPPWFAQPAQPGPVRVSTGEPVLAERIAYRQNIQVSRIERDWNATYEEYTNALNTEQVVITESDKDGVRATYTYEQYTLRMKPVTKQPMWQDGKMYFRIFFEMEHNVATWIHSEADVSQKYRAFEDQWKGDGTQMTDTDVQKAAVPNTVGAEYNFASIMTETDGNKVAIGQPMKLNGWGQKMPVRRGEGTYNVDSDIYMNFDIYPLKSYGPLNL